MGEGKQGEDEPSARPCLEGRHVSSPPLANLHHLHRVALLRDNSSEPGSSFLPLSTGMSFAVCCYRRECEQGSFAVVWWLLSHPWKTASVPLVSVEPAGGGQERGRAAAALGPGLSQCSPGADGIWAQTR